MRLACVKHAASVHSEPGSNSPVKLHRFRPKLTPKISTRADSRKWSLFSFQRSSPVSMASDTGGPKARPLLCSEQKRRLHEVAMSCQHFFCSAVKKFILPLSTTDHLQRARTLEGRADSLRNETFFIRSFPETCQEEFHPPERYFFPAGRIPTAASPRPPGALPAARFGAGGPWRFGNASVLKEQHPIRGLATGSDKRGALLHAPPALVNPLLHPPAFFSAGPDENAFYRRAGEGLHFQNRPW